MTLTIPYDSVWKTIHSFIHIFSFSLFFGSFVARVEILNVEKVTIISGFL